MREILFRGKRLDNREWVEGDVLQLNDANKNHTAAIFIKPINREAPFDAVIYCEQTKIFRDGLLGHEINPSTLCQFTGLHDKNGERIWEGDVVRVESFLGDGKRFDVPVIYEEGCFQAKGSGLLAHVDCTRLGSIHDKEQL